MQILDEVQSFINRPQPALFESLALSVFRYQAEHVPAYRAWLGSLDVDPARIRSLAQIPPVSTVAFKYARIENRLHPASPGSRVFLTSGTTGGMDGRGRHIVPRPEIYRASAIGHLRRMMFPDAARIAILALHPTADRMPESSLAQMISWCIDEFGDGHALCTATRDAIDAATAIPFLQAATRVAVPVCILGTTASCAAIFEVMRRDHIAFSLPSGSRMMDTGGAKGQRVRLRPEQVAAEAQALLGIDPAMVINEYGMTEMCSQLYDATSFNSDSVAPPGMRMKLAPPWLQPAALDPVTLAVARDGQPGLLAFFDLANVGSISALVTEDIGIVYGHAVFVLGRAAAADIRGCALAIREFSEHEKSPSSGRAENSTMMAGREARKEEPADDAVVGHEHRSNEVRQPFELLGGRQAGPVSVPEIRAASLRLRQAISPTPPAPDPDQTQAVFDEVLRSINGSSSEHSAHWHKVIRGLAVRLGYSPALLKLSLAALACPLHQAGALKRKLRPRRELIALITPANIPGAGLHELVAALIAGCAVIVKTSVSEPVFFAEFATTLHQLDARFGSDFGERLQVFNWGRERADLTDALIDSCDRALAFGDDATIAQLKRRDRRVIGFGARVSAVAVTRQAVHEALAQTARTVAVDCALFDQRGCLSPHHIFVEDRAREFASQMAAAFRELDGLFDRGGTPRKMSLEEAAAVRRVRAAARWRALGGSAVELWEDRNLEWTVVFDREARFTHSPGFCSVCVSPFENLADLEYRLAPVDGRLEGFALACGTGFAAGEVEPFVALVKRLGASYVCAPGKMQSPPLDWPHCGGEFIRLMIDDRTPSVPPADGIIQR
jgi:hypothetical protein